MEDEIDSLIKSKTWTLVSKSAGKTLIDCKSIFSVKEGNNGKMPIRFKARFVAKGFTEKKA